jgi:L-alanine-DL-glutamate epimerase-like enolase superfamily enzyme
MKISELELVALALPFAEPYVTARGELDRREMLLVRVHSDEGHTGVGEAVPLTLRGGAGLDEIARKLRRCGYRLEGTDLAPIVERPLIGAAELFVKVTVWRRIPPPAAAALEAALLDLAGRIAGEPVWKLLGVSEARPVECNATLAAGEPEAVAAAAESRAAEGFGSFKLKLGRGTDAGQVRAVREALGDDARLRIDANGTWSTDEAIAELRELQELGIELAEQPVASLREMAAVAAAVDVRLAGDEIVNDAKQARRARDRGACELATAKLAKVGGLGNTAGIAREIPTYLSSALDGPVGIAAAGHAAQAIHRNATDPGVAHGLATQRLFAETTAAIGCEVRGGRLHLPDGPGLGVELDEDALERLSL